MLLSSFSNLGKTNPKIITSSHQWTGTEIECLVNEIVEVLNENFSSTDSQAARILIPTNEPGHFLASLIACNETRCTAIPYSEEAGKGLEVLEPLLKPNAILEIRSAKAEINFLESDLDLQNRVSDIILTTTGSTGHPKGVCLTLDQLILNALTAGNEIGLKPGMRWAIETDLALTSDLCHMLMAWLYGAEFRHLRGESDETKVNWLAEAPFGYGGAPVQLANLADLAADIASPITLMSSGDFLTRAVVKKIRSAFPKTRIHKFYGLTEVSGRFCALPADLIDEFPDATGIPLFGASMSVHHQDGTNAAIGERGEVYLRSPLLMSRYIHIDGRFEAASPHQWFATGDEGMLDQNGLLTLMGRMDFSFKVGGEKADAYTIEQTLAPLLEGLTYCVMPVPHPALGKWAALFVENREGNITPIWRQVISTVANSLPTRFIPMFGYSFSELPRLPNGKIDRMQLVQAVETYERLA